MQTVQAKGKTNGQDAENDGLIPISLAIIALDQPVGIDLYLKSSAKDPAVLFCAAHSELTQIDVDRIAARGITKLYITCDSRDTYQCYLRNNWESLLEDESKPIVARAAVLSEVIRDVLAEDFATGDTVQMIKTAQQMGQQTTNVLGSEPIFVGQLYKVLHHDYATFTHSANVSFYAVMLAKELGFAEDEVTRVSVAALLHDLGKLDIDDRILTKPGKLDANEYRQIQRHPTTGFRLLTGHPDLNWAQLMMVYQHHERPDGKGYPVGCTAEEIHPFAKLCSIVDVFEALTARRPYRNPMSHADAMSYLRQQSGQQFDAEMLAHWERIMSAPVQGVAT